MVLSRTIPTPQSHRAFERSPNLLTHFLVLKFFLRASVVKKVYSSTASSSFSAFHFAAARTNSTMMGCGFPGFDESWG